MKELNEIEILDQVQKNMKTLNKFRYQVVIDLKKRNLDQPQITNTTCSHIFCEVDRIAKTAYLKITEGYQHANNTMEMYYINDHQYVRTADSWIENCIKKEDTDRIFGRNDLLFDLNLLKSQSVSITKTADNLHQVTAIIPITGKQFSDTVASLGNAAQLNQKIADTQLEITIDLPGYFIDSMKINGNNTVAEGGQNIQSTESLNLSLSPLAPDYHIVFPASLIAHPRNSEMLNLAANAGTANCLCTGCIACVACVACAACISCIACIFPPALVPVTAFAAGSAISVATSVAVGASTGIATANQGN